MRDRCHSVSGQLEGIDGTDTSDGLLVSDAPYEPHGFERDASLSGWRLWSEHSSAGELLHVSGKMPVTAAVWGQPRASPRRGDGSRRSVIPIDAVFI